MARQIHMVGIGGIAVSALAQFYLSEGWRVSGSDAEDSEMIHFLKTKGAKITVGHKTLNLPRDCDLVIYSPAVPESNPERIAARKRGIPEKTFAEALEEISNGYKLIAVSGAHGKSTTTALAALMLIRAGFDPTVFIGTKVREFGNTNFRKGKSEWMVIEADEFNRSFLSYRPFITVTTNIDREHLEYYGSFADVKAAFKKFWSRLAPGGTLILNREDRAITSLKPKGVRWYGTRGPQAARVKHLLKIPGRHNLSNAMAVDMLGEVLKIPESVRNRTFAAFRGTWRRFELKCEKNGIRVYDDYGHHPTEIKATLAGASETFPKRRLVVLFQPHHSERLRLLFSEFARAFNTADKVIILETYQVAGRDRGASGPKKNAKTLASQIRADYVKTQAEALRRLKKELRSGDILIVMGAGDIWKLSKKLCA